jgi:hypothetical protein
MTPTRFTNPLPRKRLSNTIVLARCAAVVVLLYCAVAHAQFGGSTTELPIAWVVVPWIAVIALAISSRWFSAHPRQLTQRAMRRGVAAYAFLEIVPVSVCLILSLMFEAAKDVGIGLFAMSLMGIVFSGLALLGLTTLAFIADIVIRRTRTRASPGVHHKC